MKKVFYFVMALTLLIACSTEDDPIVLPKITFADATYTVPRGVDVEVKVLLDNPVESTTRINLEFEGTAKKGTDYTAESYIQVEAGEKTGVLVVNASYDLEESKTIEVSFKEPVSGYEFGRFSKTVVTISMEQVTIFSFDKPKVIVYGDIEVIAVNLFDPKGNPHKVANETKIGLKVSDASTAVLGTHFKFVDGKDYATIDKDKSNGNFEIEVLKYEEGKSSIILECGEPDKYYYGAVSEIEIVIPKELNELIVGEWKGLDFYKLDDYVIGWGFDEQQKAALPTCGPTDIIKFNADKTFEISSQGKLKNYFVNTTWAIDGSDVIYLSYAYPPEKVTAPRCNLAAVNYEFSADVSDIKAAKVNLFVTSTSEHEEVLVLQINDYFNTTDFDFTWGDFLTFRFIRNK